MGEGLCADTFYVFEIIAITGLFVRSVNRKISLIFMHRCYSILQDIHDIVILLIICCVGQD